MRRSSRTSPGTELSSGTRKRTATRRLNRSACLKNRKGSAMRSRVLVVDHDSLGGDWMTSLLVSREYDGRAEGNADAAVSAMREWRPAAILTDLELPLVNGIQLCRRVRQQSNVPIIVLSSDSDARLE